MPVPRTISHPSEGTAALRRASRDVLSSKDEVQGVGCPSQPPCPCGIRSLPVLLVAIYRKRGLLAFLPNFSRLGDAASPGAGEVGKGPLNPPGLTPLVFAGRVQGQHTGGIFTAVL